MQKPKPRDGRYDGNRSVCKNSDYVTKGKKGWDYLGVQVFDSTAAFMKIDCGTISIKSRENLNQSQNTVRYT